MTFLNIKLNEIYIFFMIEKL